MNLQWNDIYVIIIQGRSLGFALYHEIVVTDGGAVCQCKDKLLLTFPAPSCRVLAGLQQGHFWKAGAVVVKAASLKKEGWSKSCTLKY